MGGSIDGAGVEVMGPDGVRTVHLSWDEWEERFGPELTEDGGYVWWDRWATQEERDRLVSRATASPQTIWTLLDEDGVYLESGARLVNRIAHVFTREPWEANTVYQVYDEEVA